MRGACSAGSKPTPETACTAPGRRWRNITETATNALGPRPYGSGCAEHWRRIPHNLDLELPVRFSLSSTHGLGGGAPASPAAAPLPGLGGGGTLGTGATAGAGAAP